jgi:hypothetical protein
MVHTSCVAFAIAKKSSVCYYFSNPLLRQRRKTPTDPQAAVRPSPQAGDVTATKSDWGRRVPLLNNLSPMLLTRLRGVFVRLNRTHGQGRGSARHPCRIQSAKARFTVNGVRRRRPRTVMVMPVGIPAPIRFKAGFGKRCKPALSPAGLVPLVRCQLTQSHCQYVP